MPRTFATPDITKAGWGPITRAPAGPPDGGAAPAPAPPLLLLPPPLVVGGQVGAVGGGSLLRPAPAGPVVGGAVGARFVFAVVGAGWKEDQSEEHPFHPRSPV